jgi:NADH-quinone oxidoreductase subunit L
MTAVTAGWVCLLSPLAAVLLLTLGGTWITRRQAAWLSTVSTFVSFGAGLVAFFALLSEDGEERVHYSTAWSWLTAGPYDFGLQILVDPLSVFEMLVISGIGALIIWYSVGYMDGSDEERRFFAYMSLFVFSMLLLVESGNFLLLLAGWGMVGLCSYLLIGYDQHRPAAIAAAKKAFIMNALGDATVALALFLLIQHTGALQFSAVFAQADSLGDNGWVINLIALGLLGGAVAKSAQIPLQTWLPDAMEGPTPVSALIHAATMVTAGVYLIVRAHPLFEAAPRIEDLAAGLGAATLLVAGLIALVQTDIKRVIAYSTMSQIGYMFLCAGLGAYASGMFHLMTHAFFKALLFLGAGIVIHALAGEQDIRKMRGIGGVMPYAKWTFLVGSLALVGVPPFAGFFSKDSILAAALDRGAYGDVLWAVGVAGAFLTGLYTFRLFFLVFRGQPDPAVRDAVHLHHGKEGPWTMLLPVGVLAVGSVVSGWVQFADLWERVSHFLDPVAEPLAAPSGTQETVSSIVAVGVGLLGIAIAWWIYGTARMRVPRARPIRHALEHKLYFDDLYHWLFERPADAIARGWYAAIERPLIAGSLTALGLTTREASEGVSGVQTGFVRSYVLAFSAGVGVLAVVFVSVR